MQNYPSRGAPSRASMDPALARRRALARKRRKRRILRNRIIFALICLAILALLVFGVIKLVAFIKNGTDKTPGASSAWAVSQVETDPASQSSAPPSPPPEPAEPVGPADPLLLVNNNVALPEGYQVVTAMADATAQIQLQSEAAQAYIRMKDAAAAQGIQLVLYAGYRSVEEQEQLFEAEKKKWLDKGKDEEKATEKAKTVVALPERSEHNTGLAADILAAEAPEPDISFEESEAFAWLNKNAASYGFILRYPKDKQAITGMTFKPWHYRYVGIENAAAIRDSGLCLEEYLAGATPIPPAKDPAGQGSSVLQNSDVSQPG